MAIVRLLPTARRRGRNALASGAGQHSVELTLVQESVPRDARATALIRTPSSAASIALHRSVAITPPWPRVVGLAYWARQPEDARIFDDHAPWPAITESSRVRRGAAESAVEGDVEDAVPLFVVMSTTGVSPPSPALLTMMSMRPSGGRAPRTSSSLLGALHVTGDRCDPAIRELGLQLDFGFGQTPLVQSDTTTSAPSDSSLRAVPSRLPVPAAAVSRRSGRSAARGREWAVARRKVPVMTAPR